MSVNLKALIGKLNASSRKALEDAAGLCVSRTHFNVELEHFLEKLTEQTDGDLFRIARQFGMDLSRLRSDLDKSLDGFRTGNARTPAFSPALADMFTSAWTIGTLEYGAMQIRTGFALLALLTDETLQRQVRDISREFDKINIEQLKKSFEDIVDGSPEDFETATAAAAPAGGPGAPSGGKSGKTPNLDQFTVDLTANAKAGKIDTVLGRDTEIRQIVDILMRRRQNNPILTGEAGVGKTAVVEGFALRVAAGDVPPPLQGITLRSLDLALLQAGAGVKGEFENRLKGLIEEVKSSPVPIILFIDEAHTMIGAGGSEGQGDAANLLKPALARGELRTIAATTWSEYKKYFEKDAALARRFQVVKVEEPSEEKCQVMLRGITPMLEKHHKVRILDEAVNSAVRLSHRYLVGRQLPDKAVSILDTACARLALGQSATPPALENATRLLDDLQVQKRVLEREQAAGADHAERLTSIVDGIGKTEAELAALRDRWDKEGALVAEIRELRTQLEDGTASAGTREKMNALQAQLDTMQGETPLMRVCVDSQIVSEVLSGWTGIPVGKMMKDEVTTVLELDTLLKRRLIGQDHALAAIAQRIRTSRAALDDPNKPVGVFMLVGPSGVGKTETALSLADLLYGGERNVITINMSEFQEAHTVSTLKGSPPGYVGYGEGGVLTEAVRRRPYSVVLLDEVEKAHPDVLELFFQVFDKGQMEDGEGREINFKNTIILLTTNAASGEMMKLCADPETAPSANALVAAIKPELNKVFQPAFLGRMVIIPYYPVRDEVLKQIIVLKLNKIKRRIQENHRVALTWDDKLLQAVADRCTEVESGARNVDNILTNTLLPDMARRLLEGIAAGTRPETVTVTAASDGSFVYS
ncbi:MAG TPA: type VI secretion system ATPase TssH [Bryobacteraceae bacterium]|nr:type VI secretion system ATPase TssH [Bryobacteraceae bacterium]